MPHQPPIIPPDPVKKPELISKEIPESVLEAIEETPIGHHHEIIYAALANRMRMALTEGTHLNSLMQVTFNNTLVNYRSVSPTFSTELQSTGKNVIEKTGQAYHSSLWGSNKDQAIPTTQEEQVVTQQDDVGSRGVLVAKLFHNLKSHIPLLLFNISSKEPEPIGIGGSSVIGRYRLGDNVVTELGYRCGFSVEVACVTYDDTSTSNLQTCVELVFSTLRDFVNDGYIISGKKWTITLPTKLATSSISEVAAPWSDDDKDAKLYVCTTTLEHMSFEAIGNVKQPIYENIINLPSPNLSVELSGSQLGDTAELRLSSTPALLKVTGLPIDHQVALDNPVGRRVANLVNDNGIFYIHTIRTGTFTIKIMRTSGIAPVDGTVPSGMAVEVVMSSNISVNV